MKCPSCGSLSPEKCNQPCTDKPASAYRSIDDTELVRGAQSRTLPDGSVTVTVPCDETSGELP